MGDLYIQFLYVFEVGIVFTIWAAVYWQTSVWKKLQSWSARLLGFCYLAYKKISNYRGEGERCPSLQDAFHNWLAAVIQILELKNRTIILAYVDFYLFGTLSNNDGNENVISNYNFSFL